MDHKLSLLRSFRFLCLLLVGLAVPAVLGAQGVTTSAVTGTVTDPAGQPISNAQVLVRNTATGFSRGVLTNSQGRFFIPNLQPGGPYSVAVQSIGYAPREQAELRLVLNQTTTVDFQLAQQAVALEGVTVTAENNPVISRSRTGAATVISEETLENIPSLNRNFTDVAAVSPHVYVTGEAPSVGGANNRFNNIQIDGATTSDVFGLGSTGTPGGQANVPAKPVPLDAIEQFQVLVTPFDVRQAGFTGGLINAVTKSGTNDFRGSVYGYYRNESFTRGGTLTVAGRDFAPPADFLDRQFGATLGGPIIRDRLHFFVAGEMQQRDIPETFSLASDPATIRVLPARVEEIISTAQGYGLETGGTGAFTQENRLGNLFGRLDYRINDRHRAVLRHSFSPNYNDVGLSRGGSRFDLESRNYYYDNVVNSTVLQFFSELAPQLSNELQVNYQTVTDRPTPEVRYSSVRVSTRDEIGGRATTGEVRFGSDYFRHSNELDQSLFQVTDNLVWTRGAHQLTFGFNGEYYAFRNLFVPGSLGEYQFNSAADFAAGRANYYEINVPLRADPSATFDVFQPGLYVQDQWTINDQLNVTAGLRVDVPFMLDEPYENPAFEQGFGRSTTRIPSGNALWSPRLGFNWQLGDEVVTQLRGGVGIFSGRPPYVWMSNPYGNTGLDYVLLQCRAGNVPAFQPNNPPTACANGSGPANAEMLANVVDEDFRFPQDLKFSFGIDRELFLGLTGTLEAVYSKGLNHGLMREINLAGPQSVAATATQGVGNRTIYGVPVSNNTWGFDPVRVDRNFRHVVDMTNTDRGYNYALSAELARAFGRDYSMRASYTFQQAKDVQSLTSSIATSNVGYHPVGEDLDYPVTSSAFERPHKVTFQGSATLFRQFGGTEISMIYVGMSGRTYSYVYDGDVNGDGYPGPGLTSRTNDLFYVPNDVSEVNFSEPEDARLLSELIEKEECLSSQRGRIIERNSCRGPWSNRLDMRVTQGLPIGVGNLKAELNVFNLLNLLNEDWGLQRGPSNNTVTILDLQGRAVRNDPNSPMVFSYDGFTSRDDAGVTRAERSITTFFDSRYQVQLGLRYTF